MAGKEQKPITHFQVVAAWREAFQHVMKNADAWAPKDKYFAGGALTVKPVIHTNDRTALQVGLADGSRLRFVGSSLELPQPIGVYGVIGHIQRRARHMTYQATMCDPRGIELVMLAEGKRLPRLETVGLANYKMPRHRSDRDLHRLFEKLDEQLQAYLTAKPVGPDIRFVKGRWMRGPQA